VQTQPTARGSDIWLLEGLHQPAAALPTRFISKEVGASVSNDFLLIPKNSPTIEFFLP
jgi:hypothetical protein